MTQERPTTERLLKPADVAEIVGVHRDTVMDWLRTGKLPGVKLPGGNWRVRAQTLEQWLREREQRTYQQPEQTKQPEAPQD